MNREKQIEEMADDICDSLVFEWDGHFGVTQVNAKQTAEKLYSAGYRKQSEGEWISVDERLPDPNKLVLCLWERDSDGICYGFARYQREDVWYVSNEGMPRVTHWMPLPEPPKMKGGTE